MKHIFYLVVIFYLFSNNIFAQKLEKVSLQLHWKYQFEFAGFIAAKEKGFYKDAGLDVDLKEFKFGMDVVDEVLSGRSNYGIYNSNILQYYLENKPIKLMASFFKRSALVIITKPNIKTIDDLKNKVIMAAGKKDFDLNFKYIFDQENIDTNDLKLIPHSYNIQSFIDGKCDAMTAFISDQPYQLDKLGIQYNIIDPSDYGIYNLQLELFTSIDEVNKHPKRAKAFKEASIKGWKYALTHKNEIINIIKSKYKPSLSYDFLQNEAKKTELLILPKIYKIGSIDKNFLNKQMELLKKDNHLESNKTIGNLFCSKMNNTISLTRKEQKYLDKKKELTICEKKGWLPYEDIDTQGQFIGISADFLHLYAKKLKLRMHIIASKNQFASLKDLENKKCDIKPLLVPDTKKNSSIQSNSCLF